MNIYLYICNMETLIKHKDAVIIVFTLLLLAACSKTYQIYF